MDHRSHQMQCQDINQKTTPIWPVPAKVTQGGTNRHPNRRQKHQQRGIEVTRRPQQFSGNCQRVHFLRHDALHLVSQSSGSIRYRRTNIKFDEIPGLRMTNVEWNSDLQGTSNRLNPAPVQVAPTSSRQFQARFREQVQGTLGRQCLSLRGK